ncbi:hypothetical protein FRC15_003174 [Serendipita sp. 397]|nr:hypothetical protein FRC15_003174 [Serendipita sp. 397]
MSTSSSSSIPSQEIPMVDLDVLDTYSSHDEAPVTQCRRLWFIPENLALPPRNQCDELFAKIEELVAGYIARKNALPNLKKKSGKISKTVITSSTLKETVTATVARVANLPRLPRPKVQRKTSQPKRRSSTSSSKSGKSSLILSSSPPRRRCVPSSFAQYGSDEEPFEEEEVLQFHRGTTPALSVFSEDIVPPPISDSENSSISSTSQSMRSTLIDESSTDSLPQSSTNNSVMSWTEEEEQNHSFDDDDMGERFELMEIVEDNPFSEFGVHLRLDEEANPYEQLERQLFAARERTPFDPDSSFSSLGSSSDAFPGLVTFEGFWDDSVESSPREPSVEPITVSLSDLSPPRRR